MANPTTSNFSWSMPEVNGNQDTWGTYLNETTFPGIDSSLKTVKDTADAALPKAGGTLTGNVDVKTSTEAVSDLGDSSGTVTFDLATANIFAARMTGNINVAVENVPDDEDVATVLFMKLTNSGSYSVTWPSAFKFPAGVDVGVTSNGTDVLGFITLDGGTSWLFCGATTDLS